LKPKKNAQEASSYRPITLLSCWRKLLSLIILRRISNDMDESIDRSQHAYCKDKSTGDVVLAHKILIAGSIERNVDPRLIGIDMSKAFDTVNREKLVNLLQEVVRDEGNMSIIRLLFSNTTLAVKVGKVTGEKFETNCGVPQGDALSPKMFTFYLDRALKDVDTMRVKARSDHTYSESFKMPLHIEYADDVDFIVCNDEIPSDELLKLVRTVFCNYNLILNDTKTEITTISREADLSLTTKLGSILDDNADIRRRNQLATVAMTKYNKIWKNPYISIYNKTNIYNTYVKSILTYNCSTWCDSKAIKDRIDKIHRKQLRRVLNVHYPKKISNINLYETCKTVPLSDFVQKRRRKHLGHVLRRETTAKDIYKHIFTLPRRKGIRGAKPTNILKTYRQDFETDDIHSLEEKAFARTL